MAYGWVREFWNDANAIERENVAHEHNKDGAGKGLKRFDFNGRYE